MLDKFILHQNLLTKIMIMLLAISGIIMIVIIGLLFFISGARDLFSEEPGVAKRIKGFITMVLTTTIVYFLLTH